MFAGQALAGLLASSAVAKKFDDASQGFLLDNSEDLAKLAFRHARAMMAQKNILDRIEIQHAERQAKRDVVAVDE